MTFLTIDTSQKQTVVLEKTTTTGKPIDPSPAPVYSLERGPTDPATVTPSADGFSADFASGSVPGDSVFLVQAFSGGAPVSGEVTVTVVPKPDLGELVFTPGAIAPK